MSIIQRLNELAKQNMPECLKNKTYIHGTWQIVQWCPDLISREWVNIGVGFKYGEQERFKFLDNFKKVRKVWNKDQVDFLKKIIHMAQWNFSHTWTDFTPQIKVIEVGFHKAESVEEALQSSFDRVVTLRGVL